MDSMRTVIILMMLAVLAGCKGHEGEAPDMAQEAAKPAEELEETKEPQEEQEPPADPQEVQRTAAFEMKELARGNYAPYEWVRRSGPMEENGDGVVRQHCELRFQVHKKILPLGIHAVPELVNWLDHDDKFVRYIAQNALMELTKTGAHFRWSEPPADMRASGELEKYRKLWLEWYEENKDK